MRGTWLRGLLAIIAALLIAAIATNGEALALRWMRVPEPTVSPAGEPRGTATVTVELPKPREAKPVVRDTTSKRPPVVAAPAPAYRPVAPRGGAGNYTALLIGINHAPGSTPLEGSITDVNNTKAALLKYGFKRENITVLTDGGATKGAILGALDAFARRTSGRGLAVFQMTSHSGSSGGDLTFATGGGGRLSRHELASRLARVPGKLWTNLPTCYSGGYAVRGIVGPNRLAVFSSDAGSRSWQVGGAGSWMIMYMIKRGMLERTASSVEDAYHFAKNALQKENPDRVPILYDGIAGDVKLPV